MKLLTVQETAAMLRVSDDLVRKLIKQRLLTARNLTPKSQRATYRIEESEVERYLGLTRPAPQPGTRRRKAEKVTYPEFF